MSLESALLDDEGYPAWVTALVGTEPDLNFYVVKGLGTAAAMQEVGAPAESITAATLPEAVGAESGDVHAWLGFTIGDWTVVIHDGMPIMGDPTISLSLDGHEAVSCSLNGEGDTDLKYAIDGEEEFGVEEPVTVCALTELPERLHAAAEASRIYAQPREEGRWDPAENFRLVTEFADLHFTVEDLRRLPLLGARAGFDVS